MKNLFFFEFSPNSEDAVNIFIASLKFGEKQIWFKVYLVLKFFYIFKGPHFGMRQVEYIRHATDFLSLCMM